MGVTTSRARPGRRDRTRSSIGGKPVDQLDRFDLAVDVIDRVPRLCGVSGAVRERLKNKLIEHKIHVRTRGVDLPEVAQWQWSARPGPSLGTPDAERETPEG